MSIPPNTPPHTPTVSDNTRTGFFNSLAPGSKRRPREASSCSDDLHNALSFCPQMVSMEDLDEKKSEIIYLMRGFISSPEDFAFQDYIFHIEIDSEEDQLELGCFIVSELKYIIDGLNGEGFSGRNLVSFLNCLEGQCQYFDKEVKAYFIALKNFIQLPPKEQFSKYIEYRLDDRILAVITTFSDATLTLNEVKLLWKLTERSIPNYREHFWNVLKAEFRRLENPVEVLDWLVEYTGSEAIFDVFSKDLLLLKFISGWLLTKIEGSDGFKTFTALSLTEIIENSETTALGAWLSLNIDVFIDIVYDLGLQREVYARDYGYECGPLLIKVYNQCLDNSTDSLKKLYHNIKDINSLSSIFKLLLKSTSLAKVYLTLFQEEDLERFFYRDSRDISFWVQKFYPVITSKAAFERFIENVPLDKREVFLQHICINAKLWPPFPEVVGDYYALIETSHAIRQTGLELFAGDDEYTGLELSLEKLRSEENRLCLRVCDERGDFLIHVLAGRYSAIIQDSEDNKVLKSKLLAMIDILMELDYEQDLLLNSDGDTFIEVLLSPKNHDMRDSFYNKLMTGLADGSISSMEFETRLGYGWTADHLNSDISSFDEDDAYFFWHAMKENFNYLLADSTESPNIFKKLLGLGLVCEELIFNSNHEVSYILDVVSDLGHLEAIKNYTLETFRWFTPTAFNMDDENLERFKGFLKQLLKLSQDIFSERELMEVLNILYILGENIVDLRPLECATKHLDQLSILEGYNFDYTGLYAELLAHSVPVPESVKVISDSFEEPVEILALSSEEQVAALNRLIDNIVAVQETTLIEGAKEFVKTLCVIGAMGENKKTNSSLYDLYIKKLTLCLQAIQNGHLSDGFLQSMSAGAKKCFIQYKESIDHAYDISQGALLSASRPAILDLKTSYNTRRRRFLEHIQNSIYSSEQQVHWIGFFNKYIAPEVGVFVPEHGLIEDFYESGIFIEINNVFKDHISSLLEIDDINAVNQDYKERAIKAIRGFLKSSYNQRFLRLEWLRLLHSQGQESLSISLKTLGFDLQNTDICIWKEDYTALELTALAPALAAAEIGIANPKDII